MTAEFWFGTQSVFSSARRCASRLRLAHMHANALLSLYPANHTRSLKRLLANKPEDVESGFCMLVTECRCSPQSALVAMEALAGVNNCLSNRAKKTVLDRYVCWFTALESFNQPLRVQVHKAFAATPHNLGAAMSSEQRLLTRCLCVDFSMKTRSDRNFLVYLRFLVWENCTWVKLLASVRFVFEYDGDPPCLH